MADASQVTAAQVKSITAPYGNATIIEQVALGLQQFGDSLQINTPLRKAHFLAQIAHESDHFQTTKEYGGSKTRYAPWFGRGLIQMTWKENYAAFTVWATKRGLNPPDFATDIGRDKAALFPWAFLSAVWYWETHKLNQYADADNIRAVTKIINGGYNGLEERMAFLTKAKRIFGLTERSNDVAVPGQATTGQSASDIQNALNKQGFALKVDGAMGPQTIAAIKSFQKFNGLVPDGIIGAKTAGILFK